MQRLLWAVLALIALVSAQSVSPTNSTPTTFDGFTIQVAVQTPSAIASPFANLLPLSSQAWQTLTNQVQSGNAVIATSANLTAISNNDIVFIPCDPSAYPGYQGADSVIQAAIKSYVQAIVLYSTTANYCNYSASGPTINFVFTMTNTTAIQPMLNALSLPTSQSVMALIARQSTFQNMSVPGGSNSSYPPGGSSPSTAVAMIILYSITGVITALFLIIIITGAFRAHRHPERYGPRDGEGRPRQSRARGLARAMLDTIPIVKFGERDVPKPNDIELAQNGNEIAPERQVECGVEDQSFDGTTVTLPATQEHTIQEDQVTTDVETSSHISAPASQSQATEAVTDGDEGLTCCICTEDFERGQDVRVLPCNHSFHPACIDPWLLNVSGTCPLCRVDLRPITSTASDDPNAEDDERRSSFAPPLISSDGVLDQGLEGLQRASRRVSGLARAMLNPRRLENASTQERIAALRRLRERQREAGETEQEARRRRRLTVVLADTFAVRTRRGGAEMPDRSEWRSSLGSVRSSRSVRSVRSVRSLRSIRSSHQRLETVPPVPTMPAFVNAQGGDAEQRTQNGSAGHGGEGGAALETILSNSTEERAAERR